MSGRAIPFADRLAIARDLIARSDDVAAWLGVGWQDQARAAAADTHHRWQETAAALPRLDPERQWRTGGNIAHGDERHAHLLAAVMGCKPCHRRTRRRGRRRGSFTAIMVRLGFAVVVGNIGPCCGWLIERGVAG